MRTHFYLAGILPFLISYHALASEGQENWPSWRGETSNAVVSDGDRPESWSVNDNILWQQEVPGRGWSSPIVWGNRIFVTTVENLGKGEEPKKGLYFGGNRPQAPESEHRWLVVCYDLNSGELKWQRMVHRGKPAGSLHLKNSYASETPVTDGQHLYAYFGNLGLYCFTLTGDLLWQKDFPAQPTRYGWGTAASPILHGDRLYLVNDNDEKSYMLALDKVTGEEIWRVARDEKSNWATPYLWQNSLRSEIITSGTNKVRSYDLSGNLLYELGGMSSITIPTPFAHGDLLYVTSGYVMDKKKPLLAIRAGATGDITLQEDETRNESIAWSHERAGPYNPSPLLYKNRLYVLLDRGFLACYDATTGTEIFGRRRIPNGRAFTASPWAYNDKIFCLNEDGVTFVIRAGDTFEILQTNTLAEDDMCMSNPAIVGNKLILRSASRIYCIGN